LTTRLKEMYQREIIPALMSEYGYKSVMQVPRLQKVVVNIGLGEATQNSRAMEAAEGDLAAITGQHPVITRARRSISGFKLREGMPIGMMVTLRGIRMYDFVDKLLNIALPRIRDFQGVPRNSFDGRGNYTMGIKEQVMFPEIEYDKVDKIRGMEISIVTTARTDEEGRRLLELMGTPFSSE
jgi:large subunit ribosomal protein L5